MGRRAGRTEPLHDVEVDVVLVHRPFVEYADPGPGPGRPRPCRFGVEHGVGPDAVGECWGDGDAQRGAGVDERRDHVGDAGQGPELRLAGRDVLRRGPAQLEAADHGDPAGDDSADGGGDIVGLRPRARHGRRTQQDEQLVGQGVLDRERDTVG